MYQRDNFPELTEAYKERMANLPELTVVEGLIT